jgi:hypothetical protein
MSELTPRINRIENKTTRNLLINGGMDYFQRNLTFSGTYDYRTADRWLVGGTPSSTTERSTDIPAELVGKANYSLKLSPDATATPAASDYAVIEQWVEADFAQASYGKDLKLSFYFKSNKLGIYSAFMLDPSLSGQTFVSEFEVTNTNWNKYSISIPHSQADQSYFSSGNGRGFTVGATLMSGTNYQTSGVDTWETGANKFASSNQVNFYDSIANECYLAGVMLAEDTGVDFEFERAGKDFTEELRLCQRYFEKNYPLDVTPGTGGFANAGEIHTYSGGGSISPGFEFKVVKRDTPFVTFYRPSVGTINQADDWSENPRSITVIARNYYGVSYFGASTSPNTGYEVMFTADAEL